MRVNDLVALSFILLWPLPPQVAQAAATTVSAPRSHTKVKARHRKPNVPRRAPTKHRSDAQFPANVESTPAFSYAQLSREACHQELLRRKVPALTLEQSFVGLDAPTRLTGALHDVEFRTSFDAGEPSVYSLLDCRLVLALDDFSTVLHEQGIVEVAFSSAYRPPPKATPEDQPGRRHAGGLAIDVHRLKSAELGWLSVEKDFHGLLGAKVCGPHARPPVPATKGASLLRQLVCTGSERHLFQSVLTPNYDRPHRNHIHFELTPEVRWFIVS